MRIIVMSDSHGLFSPLEEIVQRNLSADIFIHLGDGEREVRQLRAAHPTLDIRFVCGNCDAGAGGTPTILSFEADGKRIVATHGNRHGVKYGTEGMLALAEQNSAIIALFGHTHARFIDFEEGIYLLNPGSVTCPRDGTPPSYGFVDITKAGIVVNIVNL